MFVHRPGASLHTLAFGAGPRTVVALGGWVAGGEVWLDVAANLVADWRVIAIDHRGSGASDCTADRILLADMVADIGAVLDAYGIDQALIAAESSGAGVAMEFALAHPERVSGLVLAAPSWRRPDPGEYDDFIAAIRADYDAALDWFTEACLPESDSGDIRRWGRLIVDRSSPERAIQLLDSKADLTVQDRLAEIATRVVILHGTRDAIEPIARSEALAAGMPNATLQVLPGLGHAPMLTRPDLIADAIRRAFP